MEKKGGKRGGGAKRDLPEGSFFPFFAGRALHPVRTGAPAHGPTLYLVRETAEKGSFSARNAAASRFFRRKRGKRRFSFAAVCFRTPRCFLFLPPAPCGRPVLKRVFFRRKGVRRGLREGISPVFSAGETGMVNEKRPPEYPTAGNTPGGGGRAYFTV